MSLIIVRNPTLPQKFRHPVVATLGSFDGVHIGHQALCARVRALAQPHGTSMVVSFYPHPGTVVRPDFVQNSLSTLRQKSGVLASLELDVLALLHFTDRLAKLTASEFVEQILFRILGIETLVIGADAHVGHKREGDASFLVDYFAAHGRRAEVCSFIERSGERVSSGRIRTALAEGRLAEVAAMLGRRYAIEGRVVHGAGRGQKMGIPTLNIHTLRKALPPRGVYACYVSIDGVIQPAVANLGVRPTFEGEETVTLEAHLLTTTLPATYGEHAECEFVAFIREERRFQDGDALIAQIKNDAMTAAEILSRHKSSLTIESA